LPDGTAAEVVALTRNKLADGGSTHWIKRSMAKLMGISHDTVARIRRDHGLKPRWFNTFRVSTDPHFEDKFVDVVASTRTRRSERWSSASTREHRFKS
jgi:hypothetical protein